MTDDRRATDTAILAIGGTYEENHSTGCRCGLCCFTRWAATKHKKSKEAAEAEDIAKQHDNTWRALKDALPLALPSWSLPIYFSMHKDEKNEKKKK
jgi:hypothetical protein